MSEIRTAPLFTMTLQVAGMQPIGATPNGNRRIGLVAGGSVPGGAAARHGAARRRRLDHRAAGRGPPRWMCASCCRPTTAPPSA